MAVGAAIAGVVASVGVTAYSAHEQRQAQKEAQKDQEKAAELAQRKAAMQNARQRKREAAKAQALQAQVMATSAAKMGTTTGTQQTTGAISSQAGGNVGFQQIISGLNQGQISFYNDMYKANADAAKWQMIGGLPNQFGVGAGDLISNFPIGSTASTSPGAMTMGLSPTGAPI